MNFNYENQKLSEGFTTIIGCDEVGRGCLAGPVVAAAVVLPQVESSSSYKVIKSADIKDSKLLSSKRREELSVAIKQHALWSIAEVSQSVIDEINIHNATLLAMRKAVEGLFNSSGVILRASASEPEESQPGRDPSADSLMQIQPQDDADTLVVIDGKFPIPNFHTKQETVIGGDNKVISIAAASIIAKVYRDELMQKLHEEYPIYNFAQHKGYGTLHHRNMIVKHGLSPFHRVSFCGNII